MTTRFASDGLWPALTKAIRRASGRSDVAVAYFGQGADDMVPLRAGSRLVVDASEQAVGSGQTYPPGLLRLVHRGVRVFSAPNLHAKVFVVGNIAYVGSTNASSRSESQLLEAALRTDLPRAVAAARRFVRAQCLYELSPRVLRRLAKLYKPPRIAGRRRGGTSRAPVLPSSYLVQLRLDDWSDREQEAADRERPVAERRRQHGRGYMLDEFICQGSTFRPGPGDVVVQVTDQGDGRVLVSAPGTVTHKKGIGRRKRIVFLECRVTRRRALRSVARLVGRTQKRLRRTGRVNAQLAGRLLSVWQ